MCGIDATTTHVVCTNGFEIKFYPNLSSLVLVEAKILSRQQTTGKNLTNFVCYDGMCCGCGYCSGSYGGGGGDRV